MDIGKFLCIILVGFLYSCATNPAMEKYVERKIDRPFVHSDGISTFSIIGKGSLVRDVVGRETVTYPIPLPLYYTFTLFENVAVEGAGLPIAINWQLENNDMGYWGLSGGAGFGTSPYFGFHYDPTIAVARKVRVSDSVALSGVGRAINVVYTDGGPTTVGTDLTMASELQVTPWLWVQAGFAASAIYTSSYTKINGSYRFWTDEGVKTEFPIFSGISLTLFRTFDLTANYSFLYLGRTNRTFEHNYSLGVVRAY